MTPGARAEAVNATEVTLECSPDPSAPLRALAFKVVHDAQRGPVVFVRVYSGRLAVRSVVTNVSGGGGGVEQSKERVMKLLHVYADAMTEVESVDAGHICAVVGLRHTRTGDTLVGAAPRKKKKAAKDKGQIVLAPIVAPEPVFCAAMEAESHEELTALEEALEVVVREDPSVGVSLDEQTHQLLVHGMGELHLEVLHDRLVRDHKLPGVTMSAVRIAWTRA